MSFFEYTFTQIFMARKRCAHWRVGSFGYGNAFITGLCILYSLRIIMCWEPLSINCLLSSLISISAL